MGARNNSADLEIRFLFLPSLKFINFRFYARLSTRNRKNMSIIKQFLAFKLFYRIYIIIVELK